MAMAAGGHNKKREVSSRQMVIRDADPQTIAKYLQPPPGSKPPPPAPVKDSLDVFSRSASRGGLGGSIGGSAEEEDPLMSLLELSNTHGTEMKVIE